MAYADVNTCANLRKWATRMRRLLIVLAAAIVGAVAFAASASAASTSSRRYSADAFFSTSVGCVQTFVGVFPVAGGSVEGQIVGESMNVQLDRTDVCTGTPLLRAGAKDGVVILVPGEFVMDLGLTRASLHTTVVMNDSVTGQDFQISIDLAYAATTPRSCSRQTTADETTIFCDADVSGTVADSVENFTPDPGQAVFQEHRPR
jgi:hypothetical protein